MVLWDTDGRTYSLSDWSITDSMHHIISKHLRLTWGWRYDQAIESRLQPRQYQGMPLVVTET